MRIGVLTGGGDCPGLNAAIRAVVKRADQLGHKVIGIKEGWAGLLLEYNPAILEDFIEKLKRSASELLADNQEFRNILGEDILDGIDKIIWHHSAPQPLSTLLVSGLAKQGGTILHSSRTKPSVRVGGSEKVLENFNRLGLDALVVIGGEDTLGEAGRLHQKGLPVVGIPKTVDNDVWGTDYSIGFSSAVLKAVHALDDLRSTADSHHRVMVLEVMGRYTGWIAGYAGVAGGADVILVPEKKLDPDHVVSVLKQRRKEGKDFSLVIVAEGLKDQILDMMNRDESFRKIFDPRFLDYIQYMKESGKKDDFGHTPQEGIASRVIGEMINIKTGFEVKVSVIGHLQRGGTPGAFDRGLATSFGFRAVELIHEKQTGVMVALRGNKIVTVPLEKIIGKRKSFKGVDMARIAELLS